jgi:2,3-bisphosphoglycerate-independent phosphoglycerate mutase
VAAVLPFLLLGRNRRPLCGTDIEPDEIRHFNEKEASQTKLRFDKGHELMEFFMHSRA